MRQSTGTKTRGFTLVELLVVIAIIAVLAAVVTVGTQRVSASAKASRHVTNLRQLWSTVLIYSSENQGRLPPNKAYGSGTWQNHVVRWQNNLSVAEASALFTNPKRVEGAVFLKNFNSPLNKTTGNMAFGSGGWPSAGTTTEVFGRSLASIKDPSRSIALAPYFSNTKTLIGGDWQRPSTVEQVTFDAKGIATCAFVDGSISKVSRDSFTGRGYVFSYPSINQPN